MPFNPIAVPFKLLTVYFALLIKTGKHFGLYFETGGVIRINYKYSDVFQPTLLPCNDPFPPMSVCDTVSGVTLHRLSVEGLVNLVNLCSHVCCLSHRHVWLIILSGFVSTSGGSDHLQGLGSRRVAATVNCSSHPPPPHPHDQVVLADTTNAEFWFKY